MTYILGLTGSIATGKTTVAQIFRDYGCPIVDADKIAHQVVAPGSPGLTNIVANFGPQILKADGSLDRQRLGEIVFSNTDKRHLLDRINGQLIRQEIMAQLTSWQKKQVPLVILDIPLLYEYHYEKIVDAVMVAYVPRELQLKRLMARDGLSRQAAMNRINSQLDIDTKLARADYHTDNTGSIADLKQQVKAFLVKQDFSPS
ncbi:dephospho-CoA kinase [Agrilactobacillus fermenti]|uniref:dephospho-CoA kinase n=1 Tax=Agrilactobacillus fermenti TaxID=2586909 RepID=UPI001E3EEFED|nr:dephospho-CoA kinase [Agrilactobacillus fermenti]MCD2256659.1 dephospho-CoA kinase [Agrilactobacillus fermenti]